MRSVCNVSGKEIFFFYRNRNSFKVGKMKQSYHYLSVLLILFFVVDMMRADGSDVLERIVQTSQDKKVLFIHC